MNNNKTKENLEAATQKKCVCSSLQGLFIPNRQLSLAVSGCIAMLFLSFMTGYFFGGQHAAQDFMHQVNHVSFNDQMSASLCALTKECAMVNDNGNDSSTNSNTIDDDASFQECVRDNAHDLSDHSLIKVELKEDVLSVPALDIKKSEKRFYAQLIGFGTQQAAQRFAKKLESRHIPVEINKHSSRTAKGKTINWYQVVTVPYEDKQQLLSIVDAIQKTEKIQDIRIIGC